MKKLLLILTVTSLIKSSSAQYVYPAAYESKDKVEKFGHSIDDPYRWMEELDSKQTRDWLAQQGQLMTKYRNSVFANYTAVERELAYTFFGDSVSNYIKQKIGPYYFTTKSVGMNDNSPSIYFKPKISYGWDKLVSTSQFLRNDKDRIDLKGISVSRNDSIVAIGISHGGSDWTEIRLVDVESKKVLNDKIDWTKRSIAWGTNGFFYIKYDKPTGSSEVSSLVINSAIYYHKIGTDTESDIQLTEKSQRDKDFSVVQDGKFFILFEQKEINGKHFGVCSYLNTARVGLDTVQTFFIAPNLESDNIEVLGEHNGVFLVKTNYKAPKGRVMLYDYSKINQGKLLIEMYSQNLLSAHYLKDKLICVYMDKGNNVCLVFDEDGKMLKNLSLPPATAIDGFDKVYRDSMTYYYINTFAMPRVTLKFNLNTLKSELPDEDAGFALSSKYITNIVSYRSKDSTEVFMYLTYDKDVTPNESTPVLMYAYGGFGVATGPSYNPMYGMLLKRGAIIAVPLIRGGGEFGTDWHEAGRKKKKQNSVNDIAYAAKWLIENKYSSANKIVATGGSQGGWLMAEAMVQFPELFKATVPIAGVYDLLRFHLYSITGEIGYGEFGNPEDSTEFEYLANISPYHQIKNGVNYPACLVLSGTHDDRVVPFHSYKLLASLQKNGNKSNPYLLYLEENAGHNVSDSNEGFQQTALMYTFIMSQLGLNMQK